MWGVHFYAEGVYVVPWYRTLHWSTLKKKIPNWKIFFPWFFLFWSWTHHSEIKRIISDTHEIWCPNLVKREHLSSCLMVQGTSRYKIIRGGKLCAMCYCTERYAVHLFTNIHINICFYAGKIPGNSRMVASREGGTCWIEGMEEDRGRIFFF